MAPPTTTTLSNVGVASLLPFSPAVGLTLLRLLPLLSSTASLTHAYMERLTNSAFLRPAPVDSAMSRGLMGDAAPKRDDISKENEEVMEELARAKEAVVPEWFTNFFNKGVWSVIGLNGVTLISAGANLVLFGDRLGEGKVWYQVGLTAAAAHYAFVPLVGESVKGLVCMAAERRVDGGKAAGEKMLEGRAVGLVREWVGYHTTRMCTVDLLAWGCFVVGVVGIFAEHA